MKGVLTTNKGAKNLTKMVKTGKEREKQSAKYKRRAKEQMCVIYTLGNGKVKCKVRKFGKREILSALHGSFSSVQAYS